MPSDWASRHASSRCGTPPEPTGETGNLPEDDVLHEGDTLLARQRTDQDHQLGGGETALAERDRRAALGALMIGPRLRPVPIATAAGMKELLDLDDLQRAALGPRRQQVDDVVGTAHARPALWTGPHRRRHRPRGNGGAPRIRSGAGCVHDPLSQDADRRDSARPGETTSAQRGTEPRALRQTQPGLLTTPQSARSPPGGTATRRTRCVCALESAIDRAHTEHNVR